MMMTTSSTDLSSASDQELREIIASHPEEHLTLAQRAQGTLDRRQDVRKAVRHYRNQALTGFIVLLMGLVGVRALDLQGASQSRDATVRSGNAVAVQSCNRDFRATLRQRRSLRALAKEPGGNPANLEPKELDRRIRLFTRLPDCRPVVNSITDDADKRVEIPKPLYREPRESERR